MNFGTQQIGAAALFALLWAPGQTIQTVYEEGSAITYEERQTTSMIAEDVTVTIDGQELPPEASEGIGVKFSEEEEQLQRFTTRVLEVEDGAPTRVQRSFHEIQKTGTKGDEDIDETGVLNERSIVIEAGEDGETVAEVDDDGDDVDDAYLAKHKLTYDIDILLPDDEVEEGDSWMLSDEDVKDVIAVGAGLELFEIDEDESDDEFDELMTERAEGRGKVTFESIEERDGVRCAVLAFELELGASVDDLDSTFFGDDDPEVEMTGALDLEMKVDGKLWFSLADECPVALEQEMNGDMELRMDFEQRGMEIVVEIAIDLSGELESTWKPVEEK